MTTRGPASRTTAIPVTAATVAAITAPAGTPTAATTTVDSPSCHSGMATSMNAVNPATPEYAYRYAYYFRDAAGA